MKYSKVVTSFIFLAFCITATPQEQSGIPVAIAAAFRTGNAAELSKYLNNTVELSLLNKEDFYKKNTAETILRDFFSQYQSKDFVIRHQGAKNDAQYAIGSLKTTKGDFRVYFLLKKVDNELLIHLMRIEPDNEKQ